MAAFKAVLVAGVPAVSGRVYLPWDDMPDIDNAPMLQIAIDEAQIDPDQIIGQWEHTVPIKIGSIKAGKFDYAAVWDLLNDALAALKTDPTLSGLVQRIEINGAADHLTVAGDRVLWPHLAASIVFRTTRGAL